MIQTRVTARRASWGARSGAQESGGRVFQIRGLGGGLTQAESRRKDRRREPGEEGQEVVALRAGVQGSRVARSGVKG